MSNCDSEGCTGGEGIARTCSYCGGVFCTQHRLPEKHNCKQVDAVQATSAVATSGRTLSQREIKRREKKANRRECVECGAYTSADGELCDSCEAKTSTSEIRSPDVKADGTVADNDGAFEREGETDQNQLTASTFSLSTITTWVRFRIETIYIWLRSWVNTLTHLGAISIFLLGLYWLYDSLTLSLLESPTVFGQPVPAVIGSAHDTYLIGSFLVMMVGIGLSYRWIISDQPRY